VGRGKCPISAEDLQKTEMIPPCSEMAASSNKEPGETRHAVVVVAHPDDETLWAGGTILRHSHWHWTIVTLCRAGDPDRAPRFRRALQALGATGHMGDLDDGPSQPPLSRTLVQETVLSLVGPGPFDLVMTHSPFGEYTRHFRHEEVGADVLRLWEAGKISASELWMFAYEDDRGKRLPRPIRDAHQVAKVPDDIFEAKLAIISGAYGFCADSFEYRAAPRTEAFWVFSSPDEARLWLEVRRNSA
jgi:LmbE family N-acetylglucosaminyl deacetylase